MASLSEHAADERSARVLLSLIAEADDDLTGLLLGREGAVATHTGVGRARAGC